MPWPVTPDAPKTRAVKGVVVDSGVIVARSCMMKWGGCDAWRRTELLKSDGAIT